MSTAEKLKQILEGEVDSTTETRQRLSRDASIFTLIPEVVVSPKNVNDVKALVQFASTETKAGRHISLTPRAAGTDMTGGSITNSVLLDFTRHFTGIGEIHNQTIQVDPGVYYRDLEKLTLAHNLVMPSYPASKSICAIGGMVGNNAGGEKSLLWGQVKNFVTKLSVVLADGNEYTIKPLNAIELEEKISQDTFEGRLYKKLLYLIKQNQELIAREKPSTSKNSSGYYLWDVWDGRTFDLTKLLVGSQGTLGIITKVTFRLVPQEPVSKLVVVFLNNLTELGNIVSLIKKHQPSSFELYDDHTLSLAMRFMPDIAKKLGKKSISLAWQFLPELWMALTGGMPKLVLLAEFSANSEDIATQKADQAQKDLQAHFSVKTHTTKSASEAAKYWTVRRESFNLLRNHAHGRISSPFVEDIIVHPEQLPEFLPRLHAIFFRYPSFEYTIAGHAGDANFHIIPFVDLANAKEHDLVLKLSNEVYELIKEFKGSITAEHNDGIAHGAFLHKMYSPEMLALFLEVKKMFDPLNIFNPGKKAQATIADFMKYMRKA